MDLEGSMLSKLDRDSRILYVTDMCNLKNNKLANIFKKKKAADSQREQTSDYRWRVEGGAG